MISAALILASSQIPMDRDPIEASTLRKGELARVYKYGGRAVAGPYRVLVVVFEDGTAIVKTAEQGARIGLPASLVADIKGAIREIEPKALLSRPKKDPVAPSTYDGIDYYLSFRKGKEEVRWSNVTYEGETDMPLLERLFKVETLFTRSRMRP